MRPEAPPVRNARRPISIGAAAPHGAAFKRINLAVPVGGALNPCLARMSLAAETPGIMMGEHEAPSLVWAQPEPAPGKPRYDRDAPSSSGPAPPRAAAQDQVPTPSTRTA